MLKNSSRFANNEVKNRKNNLLENINLQNLNKYNLLSILECLLPEELPQLQLLNHNFNFLIRENRWQLFRLEWLANFISKHSQIDTKEAYELYCLLYKEKGLLANFISRQPQIKPRETYELHCLLDKEKALLSSLQKNIDISENEVQQALLKGQIYFAMCLLDLINEKNELPTKALENLLDFALAKKQLHFVDFLLPMIWGKEGQFLLDHLEDPLKRAAQKGDLCTVKRLLGLINHHLLHLTATLPFARKGDVQTIYRRIKISALSKAIAVNQKEVACYLFSIIEIDKLRPSWFPKMFKFAISQKQWDIAGQIIKLKATSRPSQTVFLNELEEIAANGQLDLLKGIWAIDPLNPGLYYPMDYLLKNPQKIPQPIIRWLEETRFLTSKLADKFPEPLQEARALLNDYAKGGSVVNLFFSGHWNRHHIAEIAKLVKQIDANEINTSGLVSCFKGIASRKGFNKHGELARLMHYIEMKIFGMSFRPLSPSIPQSVLCQ